MFGPLSVYSESTREAKFLELINPQLLLCVQTGLTYPQGAVPSAHNISRVPQKCSDVF